MRGPTTLRRPAQQETDVPHTVLPPDGAPAMPTPLVLRDGRQIIVRPVGPGDAPALQRMHARLSVDTIRLRFFGLVPSLSDERAHYFADLDGVRRYALAALDPENPSEFIAVVRYDRGPIDAAADDEGADAAEYAAVVRDDWQGHGLGLGMTESLIVHARESGIRRIFALVIPENNRMLKLFHRLDLPMHVAWQDGLTRVELYL